MADFRKCIPLIAVVALLLGMASMASAQSPLSCAVNQGVSTQVRAEGLAELVGDIVINCTGGTVTASGAAMPQVNVQVFLNTNVTSKITGTVNGSSLTEALLTIDDPSVANQKVCVTNTSVLTTCSDNGTGAGGGQTVAGASSYVTPTVQSNIFQGILTSANSLLFQGVPVDPPGSTGTLTIRITNVRANANQLGVSSATLIPSEIIMFITVTPNESLPVANPTQQVAAVQQGLNTLAITKSALNPGATTPLQLFQCTAVSSGDLALATNPAATGAADNLEIKLTEGFNTAFRVRGGSSPTDTTFVAATPNLPKLYPLPLGGPFESGFYNPALFSGSGNQGGIGLATQGTRLIVKFSGIPAGIVIFAGTSQVPNSGTNGSSAAVTAGLVSGVDANGAGAYGAVTPTAAGVSTSTAAINMAPLTVTAGAAAATYEILSADPNNTDQLVVGFVITYVPNTANNLPGIGTATVGASFAPTSTVTTANSSAPVPRFFDESATNNKTAFVVQACSTNILFPFVTNQAGFDTGVAISNTSADPFGTVTAAGTCILNYYGVTTGGGAAPAAQTTASVAAGSTLVFTLSSGGTGVQATPGFQGYMIAQCAFRYAHGYAFISDVGAQKLAEGYLAINLDLPFFTVGFSRTNNLGEVQGN